MKKTTLIFLFTFLLLIVALTAVEPTTANKNTQNSPEGSQSLHWTHIPYVETAITSLVANENDVWAGTAGQGVIHWRKDTGAYERFTTADGLPNNSVYAVALDQNNHLWFGTGAGITRYDGTTWTTYTMADGLPHPIVRAIYIHPLTGQVIAGAATGVVVFNGNTWTGLPSQPSISLVDVVVDLSGAYWIADNNGGVFRYDGGWVYFNDPNTGPGYKVRGMDVNRLNGDIWFAFENEGVGRVSGNLYTTFSTANGLLNNQTNTIGVDGAGHVWVSHGNSPFDPNRGLSRLIGSTWITYNLDQGVPVCCVESMAFNSSNGDQWFGHFGATVLSSGVWSTYGTGPFGDSLTGVDIGNSNQVWFGQWRRGAGNLVGTRWSYPSTYDGLGGYTVKDVAIDSLNQAWITLKTSSGTQDKGLNRFDGQNWFYYTQANSNLPSDTIKDIYPNNSNGTTWFATSQGAAQWTGSAFTTFTTADGLPTNKVVSVAADGNDVWFALDQPLGQIVHYDGSNVTVYTEPGDLGYYQHYDMDFGPNGDLWLISAQGDDLLVSQFDGNWTHFTNLPVGISAQMVVDANNTPWIITIEDGIFHFNGTDWDVYNTSNGLPTTNFYDISRNNTRRTIWISGETGLLQLEILTGLDEKAYLPLVIAK